jgi:hypothetical protein
MSMMARPIAYAAEPKDIVGPIEHPGLTSISTSGLGRHPFFINRIEQSAVVAVVRVLDRNALVSEDSRVDPGRPLDNIWAYVSTSRFP